MNRKDCFALAILTTLAAYIWWQDPSWAVDWKNTLPVALALPLFFWFGMPWKLRPADEQIAFPVKSFGVAIVVFAVGSVLSSTFVLATGWTLLLWSWLKSRLPQDRWRDIQRMLALPLLAFPWIISEGARIGWYFRMSGAAGSRILLRTGRLYCDASRDIAVSRRHSARRRRSLFRTSHVASHVDCRNDGCLFAYSRTSSLLVARSDFVRHGVGCEHRSNCRDWCCRSDVWCRSGARLFS